MTSQDTPENPRRPLRRLGATALCCIAPALLAACSSAPRSAAHEQPRSSWSEDQPSGSSAELVFSGLAVQTSQWFVPSEGSSLALRRDAGLGAPEPSSAISSVAYPEECPSSLDRLRSIYISPSPDRVQYYRNDRRRHW